MRPQENPEHLTEPSKTFESIPAGYKYLHLLHEGLARKVDPENCFISEITLAELKFGVAKSQTKKKNQKAVENFLSGIQVLPIFPAPDIYAAEKARLQKSGEIIDDFDLRFGSFKWHNRLSAGSLNLPDTVFKLGKFSMYVNS